VKKSGTNFTDLQTEAKIIGILNSGRTHITGEQGKKQRHHLSRSITKYKHIGLTNAKSLPLHYHCHWHSIPFTKTRRDTSTESHKKSNHTKGKTKNKTANNTKRPSEAEASLQRMNYTKIKKEHIPLSHCKISIHSARAHFCGQPF